MVAVASEKAIKLWHEATLAFSEMERVGMLVDEKYLKKAIKDTEQDIKRMQEELHDDPVYKIWRKRFGYKTNLGSDDQLAKVVFEDLGYKEAKARTSTGKYKADKSALEHIDLPFVRKIIELEARKKARSTNLIGIQRECIDGYIHPIYNLNTAITFRSSCCDPNMQNPPVRDPFIGKLIRRCFIAPPGYSIGELDESQLEWRVAGCYSLDQKWIAYCTDPTKDIHKDTARQLFCLEGKNDWDPEHKNCDSIRYNAKNKFVFAEVYGSYYRDCALSLWDSIRQFDLKTPQGVPLKKHMRKHGIMERGECFKPAPGERGREPVKGTFEWHVKEVEKDLWQRRFKDHYQWRNDWWNEYCETGWFRMKTGFVVRGLYDRNQVLNSPVQGSAFHIVLWAIIRIQKWLKKHKMKSKVCNQIHDAVMLYLKKGEEQAVLQKAKQIMTEEVANYYKWIVVPLMVDAKMSAIGGNWSEMEKVKIAA